MKSQLFDNFESNKTNQKILKAIYSFTFSDREFGSVNYTSIVWVVVINYLRIESHSQNTSTSSEITSTKKFTTYRAIDYHVWMMLCYMDPFPIIYL